MFNWYLAGGDFGYYWPGQIRAFSWLPQVYSRDLGFGLSRLPTLWFEYPYRLILKILDGVGLSWWWVEKLLWLSVIIIAVYSSYRLAKSVLGKSRVSLFAPVIYVANTYFLLLLSGRQLGVAWAYSFAPFVLFKFMENNSIANGLWLALLVALDLRIAYLILAAVLFYYFVERKFNYFAEFILSLLVAASVHLYWLLPTVLASRGAADLGGEYTNPGMLKFLSFADFPHALSLLHPNWPENIFGKVYFLQPEFLLIPILAFTSLFFIQKHRVVIFFALLSILGAFFSKGVNDPFGVIFQWCFTHVPGFVIFRDPTKFYIYTAISYSVLIPFLLKQTRNRYVLLVVMLFWVVTIRAVITGPVMRNFLPRQLPGEYSQLHDMLVGDPVASRTLWIPQKESFAYYSDNKPVLTASSAASIDPSVKYIIVPIDVNRSIFLKDYKFDPILRENIINEVSKKRLLRDERFRDLAVFENPAFTGVRVAVPAIVERQQQLANIGLGISAGFLFIWTLWIFLH